MERPGWKILIAPSAEAPRGPGLHPVDRLLAASRHGVFVVHGDGRVEQLRPQRRSLGGPDAGRAGAAGFTADGHGRLWLLGHDGSLHRGAEGSWRQVIPPTGELAGRRDVRLCHDAAAERVVIWGGRTGDRLHPDTWSTDGGRWQRLAARDPFEHDARRQRRGRDPRSARHHVVYDGHLQQVVLLSDGYAASLQGARWVMMSCIGLASALRAGEYQVCGDGAELLLVSHDVVPAVHRFDAPQPTWLTQCEAPARSVAWASAADERPTAADWVFDPASHELLLFGTAAALPSDALALDGAFAAARAAGPRAIYPTRATLSAELGRAIDDTAVRLSREITDDMAKQLTGLTVRSCPDFLLRHLAIDLWHRRGAAAVAKAIAGSGVVPEAGQERFVTSVVKAISGR